MLLKRQVFKFTVASITKTVWEQHPRPHHQVAAQGISDAGTWALKTISKRQDDAVVADSDDHHADVRIWLQPDNGS